MLKYWAYLRDSIEVKKKLTERHEQEVLSLCTTNNNITIGYLLCMSNDTMPANLEIRAFIGSFVKFLLLVSSYILGHCNRSTLYIVTVLHLKLYSYYQLHSSTLRRKRLFNSPLKDFLIRLLSTCIIYKYALFST